MNRCIHSPDAVRSIARRRPVMSVIAVRLPFQEMGADAMHEAERPLVTVAIAVFNAGQFLRPSVESILSQTYQNLEVFVVDDGSTDSCLDSLAGIDDGRLRILSQGNQGKAVALNRVMDAASGA